MARAPLLTAPAVRAIRRTYFAAKRIGRRPMLKPFAHRYGVSDVAISKIARFATYRWVR